MATSDIPDTDTVVRYVRPTLIDGTVITGTAFCLRTGETGLSSNWLERLAGTLQERLSEIRRRARIVYARNGKLVMLNVGRTRQFVSSESSPQCTVPDGDSPEAEAIGDLIASCVEPMPPSSI